MAQHPYANVKETILKKTFNIEKDGIKVSYKITVYNTANTLMRLKEEDKNKQA